MTSVTQGAVKTSKNNRDQRPVAALVLGLLAALSVLGWVFFLLIATPGRDSASASRPALDVNLPAYWAWLENDSAAPVQFPDPDVHPVYAYSVIPGGVRNNAELKRAIAHDPIAASHYVGFDAQKARPVKLDRPRLAYVSYRLGNHIYWTTKKVTLRTGETLLTDGTHLVRGRCGNRISEVPAAPTSDGEPPEPVLNAPVLPHAAIETVDLPPPPPIWTESPTPFLSAMAPTPSPSGGGGVFVPPLPFVPCCSGGSGNPHAPPSVPAPAPPLSGPPPVIPPAEPGPSPAPPFTPPPPVTPPVATPEPRTIELLLIGLSSAFLLMKLRRP